VTIIESRPSGVTTSGSARAAGGLQTDWAGQGRCLGNDPDALFVRGAAQQNAKIICQKCPVIAECLADALDNRTEFGVWGGMTERERRAMLRRHPNVTSWRNLFQTARLDRAEVSTAS
jgi:WhiB family redox-sensing transcriptional regulator